MRIQLHLSRRALVLAIGGCMGALLASWDALAQPPDKMSDELFQRVSNRAADIASRAYAPSEPRLPDALKKLGYEQYGKLRFRKDHALWRNETLFEIEFFHPGFLYEAPVTIHMVDGQEIREIEFDKDFFDYEQLEVDKAKLPDDMGFAGFRVHFPLDDPDYKDEVAVFLGASYLRMLGRKQAYGISARGIAVNTTEPSGEEFPIFREFWLVKPEPEATSLTIYALLDGPSLTGAYRFDIHPGAETAARVKKRLYFRRAVKRLGVAPLTSMFLYGENRTRFFDDTRPEVHDSDGLLVHNGSGEWIWRPLNNPPKLRVTSFLDSSARPNGFGLIQRDRDFGHYLDIQGRYERRPGFWVVPHNGSWGKGSIQLVEIPSREEINDNIVAFWVPEMPPKPGDALDFQYSIHAISGNPDIERVARVKHTQIGWASNPGSPNKPPRSHRRFIVDFEGGELADLESTQPVKANLTTSSGHLRNLNVTKIPQTGGWRVEYQLQPDTDEPADMRLYLSLRGKRLSEVWSYLWSPDEVQNETQ